MSTSGRALKWWCWWYPRDPGVNWDTFTTVLLWHFPGVTERCSTGLGYISFVHRRDSSAFGACEEFEGDNNNPGVWFIVDPLDATTSEELIDKPKLLGDSKPIVERNFEDLSKFCASDNRFKKFQSSGSIFGSITHAIIAVFCSTTTYTTRFDLWCYRAAGLTFPRRDIWIVDAKMGLLAVDTRHSHKMGRTRNTHMDRIQPNSVKDLASTSCGMSLLINSLLCWFVYDKICDVPVKIIPTEIFPPEPSNSVVVSPPLPVPVLLLREPPVNLYMAKEEGMGYDLTLTQIQSSGNFLSFSQHFRSFIFLLGK